MSITTDACGRPVLITIRSLLDNKPYLNEPNKADNPSYNKYVQYMSWSALLLGYLKNESNSGSRAFLQDYLSKHSDDMLAELDQQKVSNKDAFFTSPYGGTPVKPNYDSLIAELKSHISKGPPVSLRDSLKEDAEAPAASFTNDSTKRKTDSPHACASSHSQNGEQSRKRKFELVDLT